MNTSPRGAASGPVGNSSRDRRGTSLGRTSLLTASLTASSLLGPTHVYAQAPASVDTTHADSSVAATAATTTPVSPTRISPSAKPFTFWSEPAKKRETPLPFAAHLEPRTYPAVSVGFGIAWYASSFKGVARAFGAVEDTVRRTGYFVPPAGKVPAQDLSMLTLRMSATPRLGATFQLGETNDGDNRVRLVGGFAWYDWNFANLPFLSLTTGVGGGLDRFTFHRAYGVTISPVGAGGGYTTLDFVQFEGHGAYATVAAEAVVRTASQAEFSGTLQYLAAGDVSSDLAGLGRQSINVSGCTLGVSFAVTF